MSLTFGKQFKYLIIQPNFKIVDFNTYGYNTAFRKGSGATFNVGIPNSKILKVLLPDIKLQIPIALLGLFGDTFQGLFGYVQKSATKTMNIQTKQVSNLINNISKAGEFNGSIEFADDNIFTQERGEVNFHLGIQSTLGNLLDILLTSYLELASKTLFNVRFHYISNNIVIFNMVLKGVTEDSTENNKSYSLSFYKPEENSTQDYSGDVTGDEEFEPDEIDGLIDSLPDF